MTVTGLQRVIDNPGLLSEPGRLGLLFNQASVDSRFRNAADLIAEALPNRLAALFGPQHGTESTEQDNMRETAHCVHSRLGLPVYSLYSGSLRPAAEMLDGLDAVLVDIQDVGARVYTFASTLLYLMEACAAANVSVIVLDRPNPINGRDVEGNLLDPLFASFVGPHPVPMRHGMTLGELAMLYNSSRSIGCRLAVIGMQKWDRSAYFDQTALPWVMPSPNMPLVETAVVYPGQVMLEGTNLSEGRGTTRPFELFGAPYIDPGRLLKAIEPAALDGVALRSAEFKPTFNKWAGQACRGFQIHVVDRGAFRPFRFTLALLAAVIKLHRDDFRWSDPPYEYVYDKPPIDVICGSSQIRQGLEAGVSVLEMEEGWAAELGEFSRMRSEFFLYK
jgi:uncharacterized protein YbbC (DUF1343 family)